MKVQTKIVACFFWMCLCAYSVAYAQLTFHAYATESYYPITSYLGKEGIERANGFQFDINGPQVNVNKWSLSVRLASPVQITDNGPSKSGGVFPMNKISFRWTVDNADPNMNLQNFGANLNEIILQEGNEIMLIDRARVPLHGRGKNYVQILLNSTLKIAAGKYLENYQSAVSKWAYIKYKVPLVYTLYDEQKNVLGMRQIDYLIQIAPDLTDGHMVDVEPEYSLVLGTEAANATLRFLTTKDYLEGVSLNLENAVKVNAKTNFELRIKALDPELMRAGGATLPLSILSTKLTPSTGAKPVLSNPEITLATTEQVLLSGTSIDKKDAQYFNLNYKAKLSPSQLGTVKPGDYSLSVLYLLLPK